MRFIVCRQGPWNVDLRTPPGPEGSNGSLLRIRRGHPGFSSSSLCATEDCARHQKTELVTPIVIVNRYTYGLSGDCPKVPAPALQRCGWARACDQDAEPRD